MATLFNGTVVSQYEEEGNRYDVRVRLADTQRQELADLSNIFLPGMVPLSQVTETVFSSAPNEISRYDRTREITLSANLENTSLGEFEREFMKRVEQELEMPEGYRLYASGQSEFMGDTFNTMFIALFAGILFIFLSWRLSLKATSIPSPSCCPFLWPWWAPSWVCWSREAT